MKQHHHLNVKKEMKDDLKVWLRFLNNPEIYCRPFIDYSIVLQADDLDWYTDASGVIGSGDIIRTDGFNHTGIKVFYRNKTRVSNSRSFMQ